MLLPRCHAWQPADGLPRRRGVRRRRRPSRVLLPGVRPVRLTAPVFRAAYGSVGGDDMSTVEKKPLTAEEFFDLPDPTDGTVLELVRGEVVAMPGPGLEHGEIQVNVAFQ